MIFLRWLLFLPALLIVTATMQAIGGHVGEQWPWWMSIPAYAVFGWTLTAFATGGTAQLCPNLKIGGWMFLGIFLVLEPIAIINGFTSRPAAENIIRIGNDVSILTGLFVGAIQQSERRNKANNISLPQ